jgi:type IV pilus assembly protein PilM
VDEQSIWKREISFRRKSKEKQASAESDEKASAESGEQPTSIWKKEISLRRKPKQAAPKPEPVADTVSETGKGPEESVWQRAVSFTPSAPAAEVAPEPADQSEPGNAPSEHVKRTVPETGPEETEWKKEVSFSRKPEEPVAAEEPLVKAEPVPEEAPVPVAEAAAVQPVAPDEPAANEEPVTEEPSAPVAEAAAEQPAATEEDPVAREEPVSEETRAPVAAPAEQPAAAPAWSAKPVPKPQAVAEAPTVVHPPVPKADLPTAAEEKVPFWKKDISFGGKSKKRDKPSADSPPKEKREKQPKIKAERGSKGSKRLVGLKIGASQLAAARVANNGSAELLQVAREPLAPGIVVGGELRDPDALAAALKDFFMKHKLPKRGIRLGIANNRIGVRTFEIAGIDDQKQLANAIRFRAQEALPIPIDEAVLDFHVLGDAVDDEGQPTKRILLVVAYRELIDRYVDACRKAGLALAGIDLEAFALLRALHPPQAGVGNDPAAALVAVAIGHERSTFAVSDGRICEFTRVLEWGGSALNVAIARVLDAAPSEVEHVKHELTLTDSTVPDGLTPEQATKAVEAMRRAVHTFARELVSSLQYYQNQPGSLGIGEVVLTGGTAHLPGLAGELEGLIGVRVRVGDPLARMKVSKRVGDPEQVGSLAVAIGLGIED